MKKHWEKFKKIVIAIGIVVGAIAAILQIYQWIIQPKMNLVATIDVNEYSLPTDLKNKLSAGNAEQEIDSLFKEIERYVQKPMPFPMRFDLHDYWMNLFNRNNPWNYGYPYTTIAFIHIKNTGDREIQGLQLAIHKKILYEYLNNNGSIVKGENNGVLDLGALRPTEELNLKVWGIESFDDIKITYPDGAITPEKLIKLSGSTAIFVKYYANWPLLLIVASVTYLLFLSVYYMGRSKGIKIASVPKEDDVKDKDVDEK